MNTWSLCDATSLFFYTIHILSWSFLIQFAYKHILISTKKTANLSMVDVDYKLEFCHPKLLSTMEAVTQNRTKANYLII